MKPTSNTIEPCEKCLPIIRYHKAERDAVLFALKMAEEERDALRAELEAYRRGGGEIARLTILLRLASGALVDAGTVQTDDVDAGIRALTAERDAMQSKRDAVLIALKMAETERDALLRGIHKALARWEDAMVGEVDHDIMTDMRLELEEAIAAKLTGGA